MRPRADHGEESYRGCGRLQDLGAVITDRDIEQFGKDTFWGQPGQPAEIAPTYVFLGDDPIIIRSLTSQFSWPVGCQAG